MSKSDTTENDVVLKVFNATSIPWDGIGNLYVALHTADPLDTGDQTTFEATYTGYARRPVSRDAGGWTVAGNQAENLNEITFGECTFGTNTVTHVSIGTAGTLAGQILYSGALNNTLVINPGIIPRFLATALQVQED